MKIVFAAVFNSNSTNLSQANAFDRVGVDLIRFEIRKHQNYNYDKDLIELCNKEKPDLLLLSKCQEMSNHVIRAAQEMGIKCYLWFMDPLFTFKGLNMMQERVQLCDHSFFNIWETFEHVNDLSPNCSFLQEGFDADVEMIRVDIAKTRDVAFIGNLRAGRHNYHREIGFEVISNAYGKMHSSVVAGTRINLNFTDGGASDRVYKVMASGGFLLTEPWPHMEDDFRVGVDFDVFTSVEELRSKIDYYLKNNYIREKIAMNGYNSVQRFNRDEWCRRIVNKFREGI